VILFLFHILMKNIVSQRFLMFFTVTCLSLGFLGCTIGKPGKWSAGYKLSGAVVPAGCVTASVQYFQNQASQVYPTLAMKLTEALKDKILSGTSLKIVNGPADVNFEGIIESYSTTQPIAAQGGDNAPAALNRFSITIKVKYSNAKDQQYDFDFTPFTRFHEYGQSVSPETEQQSQIDDLVSKLIDDVFTKAFTNW
jgi:hypothetical protein